MPVELNWYALICLFAQIAFNQFFKTLIVLLVELAQLSSPRAAKKYAKLESLDG
ncbi:MAG: hypothetical protein IT342_12035 [Candidatus Melainabacteria bacterium]|nr:hypothetical protein [Candidatus Melainabacteria bacterium]